MSKRVKTVDISGVNFRISRMGVLTSGPLLAWLQNSFKDTISAAMSGVSAEQMNGAIKSAANANLSDASAHKIAETIKSLSATLTERQFSEILERLLFAPECITFSRPGGKYEVLTRYNIEVQEHEGGLLVGAIEDPADMLLLLVEVVRHNYADFFPKLLGAIGKLMPKPDARQQQKAAAAQQ